MIVLNITIVIPRLCVPPGISGNSTLSARRAHRLKTGAQVFPRNHPVELQKRIVLGVKTGIPVPKIAGNPI